MNVNVALLMQLQSKAQHWHGMAWPCFMVAVYEGRATSKRSGVHKLMIA